MKSAANRAKHRWISYSFGSANSRASVIILKNITAQYYIETSPAFFLTFWRDKPQIFVSHNLPVLSFHSPL
ncbi:hypothetical protein KCP78_22115 [Salmonella enterica subsp. enterica]|nr:hypothetical protein KCP78_22115 [Salmonella enterica subsp. enterica]